MRSVRGLQCGPGASLQSVQHDTAELIIMRAQWMGLAAGTCW